MILKKLEIKNIKSISHTEVDFQVAPLKDASIFLICGPTGAGKSTILDSICLALYRTTPSVKEGKSDKFVDANDNEVALNSSDQVLRNGAKEALVKLDFIGNDNEEYLISWNIHLTDSNNMVEKWTLTRLSDGKLWERVGEINAMITGVDYDRTPLVGMDFADFRKTTLLAQGDFALFLGSSAQEKAAILEKVTGQHIYTKIGKYIYEHAKELNSDLENFKTEMGAKAPLTEDDLKKLDKDLETCTNDVRTKTEEQQLAANKAEWLKNKKGVDKDLAQNSANQNKLKEDMATDSYKREEEVVAQWEVSAVAREQQKTLKDLEDDLDKANRNLPALQGRLAALLGEMAAEKQNLDKEKEECGKLNQKLNTYTDGEKLMFDNAQTIVANIDQAHAYHDAANEAAKTISKIEGEMPELSRVAEKSKEEFESKKKDLDSLQREIDGYDAEIKKLDPVGNMQEHHDALVNLNNALGGLNDQINVFETAKSRLEGSKKAITESEGKIKDLESELEDARKAYNSAKSVYDNLHLTVEDSTKRLRHLLKVGCDCPVCGQKVNQIVNEAVFDAALAQPKKDFDAAETRLNTANANLQAERLNKTNTLEPNKENAEHDLENAENELKARISAAESLYGKAGLSAPEVLGAKASVDAEITRVQAESTQVDAILEQIRGFGEKRREAQSRKDDLQKDVDGLKHKSVVAANNLENAGIDLGHAENNRKTNLKYEKDVLDTLGNQIVITDWSDLYTSDYKALQNRISTMAAAYVNDTDEAENLKADIKTSEANLGLATASKDAILAIEPEWTKVVATTAERNADMVRNANSLATDVSTWHTNVQNLNNRIAGVKRQLQDFFFEHDNLSSDILEALARAYTDDSVKSIKASHRAKADNLKLLEGAAEELQKRLEELLESKPASLTDAEMTQNVEELSQKANDLAKELDKLNQNVGSLRQQKQDDNKKRAEYEKMKPVLAEKKETCQKWDKLNELLGSANGDKFNKKAQGFVLNVLLAKANYYLAQFDDDFELYSQDNSLVILVKDRRNGNSTLAPTSLSGGQKFMVSLALALGLSDMADNTRNKVDTLFIDEGFGSLSEDFLVRVMDCLSALHKSTGKHVGIISHVDLLRQNIPVRIELEGGAGAAPSKLNVVPKEV